ncbi:hypothetical protein SULI_02045 [Saccharolobus solfataricus]|uniref:Uncharacterized protein n=2 Tax=Saccharolobus solfataricus TaxID=2287 RepID=A0A0E3K502_SACSO|nr:hypothetical protein [Saccharolobus solfataricus]AKA72814.1 hypothetical protein SULB_0402 [Saccharolobus solfataricus]AKA75513.1 hypothetical protein SULC_0400 [Saccharolobus solfataricus]AKA78206.1 hypothetical protein SULA_0400 [Saccharolobus solfataricus]AZF67324.1 hypothetical protein SULG_02045 [Saccharolobus solfataricus]AZF69944.1 hypothetical protein SULH_02045 [Saccharolobus solfataricus]
MTDVSGNNITFNDILQYEIIKRTYQNIITKLNSRNLKTLKEGLKELLNFVRDIKNNILDKRLRRAIQYQQKLAKRLLLIINIRYAIFFIYKILVNTLVSRLYESIKTLLEEVSNHVRY